MPWLPFSSAAAKWQLAAAALSVVRSSITAGCVASPGAAGPKAPGPPGGLMVTVLAAKVTHQLATAGVVPRGMVGVAPDSQVLHL